MLPLDFIRKHPDEVRRAAALKLEPAPIDEILELDRRWRERLALGEKLTKEQRDLSGHFAESRDQSLLPRLKELAEQAKAEMAAADALKRQLDDLLLRVPNLFHESVPAGESEADNVVVREWGERPKFDFPARTHYDLGETLGILDLERAARVSGARFAFLKGAGAQLERAMVQLMLDLHTREHGYTEMLPPQLVNSAAMIGTGNLPKFGEEAFRVEGRDLWLIPTAEVPVTNYHREEILDGSQLPLKFVAYSTNFRSEAGAAGKDTRGYIRLHQFSKVEMVKLTTPQTSIEELESLVADAEDVLQRLGLHYQVMVMCTADVGFAQYKKYDINAWAPGLERYLEVSSCSLFSDFQSRRASLRFRPAAGQAPQFVHTLNGSGLATPRTWSALVETYQQADGSILIPEVLRPYLGGLERITAGA